MHKSRSLARHTAWYDEDDYPPGVDDKGSINFARFNPITKHRSKHKTRRPPRTNADVEQLIHVPTNHSENCATPSNELDRKKENKKLFTGPPHATSMPIQPTRPKNGQWEAQPPSVNGNPLDHSDSPETSEDSPVTTSDTVVVEKAAPSSDGSRKRKNLLGSCLNPKSDELDGNGRRSSSQATPPKPKFTVMGQLRATIFNSWLNVLFVFIPVGIAMNFANVAPVVVFVTNFIAIVPLAAMLSYATEEIALRTGETIGGLLNATFGNAVELIVSIVALAHNEIVIVQTSLIGSMLSNLLLVLGMCFFFGGLNRLEQNFNIVVAQTASSLLSLAVASLIIPTAFAVWSVADARDDKLNITKLSRGTAILLLLVYASYLYFQLKTHILIYNQPSQKVEKRKGKVGEGDASRGMANVGAAIGASMGGEAAPDTPVEKPEEKEEPQLSVYVAMATLAISTALVGICAEFLVDSINDLVTQAHLSKTFVGLILLPIVGNAAEHATAVTVAIKDKMDLAIGVAVGSSLQIALSVIPFVVVLGWIMGKNDMNLEFDGFQIATLFVSVLLVNYLIQDGKSHWLEGVLLLTLYFIIAIAAWFYPASGVVA